MQNIGIYQENNYVFWHKLYSNEEENVWEVADMSYEIKSET